MKRSLAPASALCRRSGDATGERANHAGSTSAGGDTSAGGAAPTGSPCPTLPPNEGQPRDPNAVSDRQYGACGVASYVEARCKNRIWMWTFPSCN